MDNDDKIKLNEALETYRLSPELEVIDNSVLPKLVLFEPAEDKSIVKPKKNVHVGHRQRLKDRYMKEGLANFKEHEVIELMLFYSIPRRDTNEIAHDVVKAFGGLHHLFDATPQDIVNRTSLSENSAILISMIPDLFKLYNNQKWVPKSPLNTSNLAGEYAISLFIGENYECFYVICLDMQSRLITSVLVNRGTIDEAPIYPRKIVEVALQYNAVNVILVHNHPSGEIFPSENDIIATNQIIEALSPIQVNVLDHIIVGGNDFFSFSQKHLLNSD